LREANGRLNRYGAQRSGRGNGPKPAHSASSQDAPKEQPAPAAATSEEEAAQKPRKTNAKTRSKAQSLPAEGSSEIVFAADSPVSEGVSEPIHAQASELSAPETTSDEIGLSGESGDSDGEPNGASSSEDASSLTRDAMAAFGFDVFAAAADSPVEEAGK